MGKVTRREWQAFLILSPLFLFVFTLIAHSNGFLDDYLGALIINLSLLGPEALWRRLKLTELSHEAAFLIWMVCLFLGMGLLIVITSSLGFLADDLKGSYLAGSYFLIGRLIWTYFKETPPVPGDAEFA